MQSVIKRNGEKVPFNSHKIYDAVLKAFNEVNPTGCDDNGEDAKFVTDRVCEYITEDTMSVEDIQDIVEGVLMGYDKTVAKAYITYRYRHSMARDEYKSLMNDVKEKLSANNVQNQNANVDEYSFGGRIGEATDLVMKRYALEYCMSDMARNNHLNNEIYIHDLSNYPVGNHNCMSIPFDDLLAKGFNTRQTDVRPAQSVNTAFQLLAVIFQLQSLQQFGGVSATHLDWTMVPYVRKSFFKHYVDGLKYICNLDDEDISKETILANGYDAKDISIDDREVYAFEEAFKYAMDMTTREVYQAVEGMYHNLNTLQSRSGNQLPFTSINYGTCTLPEGRLITRAILDTSINGIGKLHKTSIFPCGIFQCMKGVNRKKGEPNYDLYKLALKSTSLRLYPNYANVDWSGNAGYDVNDPRTYFSTMGCRTANGWDINGFGQLKDGRGNICPVTIIMPTLAMKSKKRCEEMGVNNEYDIVNEFMSILTDKIYEAKDMLLERFEWICSQNSKSAKFMYENNVMAGYDGKDIRSALKHGTLAIGQLGLAEALQILIGCDHTEKRGMRLAKQIEGLFKEYCDEFKEQYKLNFGVYYTPEHNR